MGVYTELYAPIFNYMYNMAQADNNTNTTKKQTRKYTRGLDEVDLDAWLSNVSAGWDKFKNDLIGRTPRGDKKTIAEEDIPGLEEAYDILFKRFNSGDGSLVYNYDTATRGFSDTTGALLGSNTNKYLGLVAKHFGDTLRKMDAYSEPVADNPNKIKYGDDAISKVLTRKLLGSTGTVRDFIDRDRYHANTRTRSNTVRTGELREAVRTTAADLRAGSEEFSDWTEDQRTNKANELEQLFTIFDNDHQITEDEYLQLARTTGMSNLRELFATGEQTAPTVTSSDGTQQRSGRTYADFIRWAGRKYKPFTGTLIGPVSIAVPDTEKYGEDTANLLSTAIQNASIQDLHSLLRRVIEKNNYNINEDEFIRKVFQSKNPRFSAQYVLGQVLNNLKGRSGGLHNFGEDNLGAYYIPNTKTSRNTGFVWDSNDNSISEVSIHNIPYWRDRILREWQATDNEEDLDQSLVAVYNRFKEGGVLYAQKGSTIDRNGGRGPGFTGPNTWLSIPNTPENAYNTETWGKYYNITGIDNDISTYGPNTTHKFWNYGYKADEQGNPIKGEGGNLYGLSAAQLGIYLNRLNKTGASLTWDKKVDDKGYEKWNKIFNATGLNMYFGGDQDKFDFMGPSTWSRHDLLQKMQETHTKDNPLVIGEDKLYWDGHMWVMPNIADTMDKPLTPSVTVKTGPFPKSPTVKIPEVDTSGDSSNSGKSKNLLNVFQNFAPDLLGATRLAASLRANNKIEDILRPSLNPVLKDTYEKYSPITGAFSQMQFKNEQAADVQSRSHSGFTSDPNLTAARMFEGQMYANDLQSQGRLADDKEIKRTKELALSRQEDNMDRRSQVANFNRASINQTNREIAKLEATGVNKNWKSWDNYLGEIEQKAENERLGRLAFAETVADDNARREYEALIQPAKDALNKWLNSPEAKGKTIIDWEDYDKYIRFIAAANDRYSAARLSGRAGVYSYIYDNPYAGENGKFDWTSFIKNGGIIKHKQQDFIAQIIKLNNERNS